MREEGELEAPGQLFDYVTEEEYAHLVRERQAEGFILDDGEQGCDWWGVWLTVGVVFCRWQLQ